MVAASTHFASSFAGEFLVPLSVLIAFAILGYIVKMLSQVRTVIFEVREIKKEVLPNGGSSLRDAVNRVETEQVRVAKDLKKHLKMSSSKRKMLDEMYADVAERRAA